MIGQCADLGECECASGLLGVDACQVERFVNVDVAETCGDGLVEQCGFDRASGAAEAAVEGLGAERKGIGAK